MTNIILLRQSNAKRSNTIKPNEDNKSHRRKEKSTQALEEKGQIYGRE